jgi:hypothetical protein
MRNLERVVQNMETQTINCAWMPNVDSVYSVAAWVCSGMKENAEINGGLTKKGRLETISGFSAEDAYDFYVGELKTYSHDDGGYETTSYVSDSISADTKSESIEMVKMWIDDFIKEIGEDVDLV